MIQSVLILCDRTPIGSNSAVEAIRLGSGFLGLGEDIECKLILMGDAVLLLKNNLNPGAVGMDSVEEGIEMADLSELEIMLVKEDLEYHGLTESDLQDYEALKIIGKDEISQIIGEFDTVMKY